MWKGKKGVNKRPRSYKERRNKNVGKKTRQIVKRKAEGETERKKKRQKERRNY
jgi:hypothetical protein